ncbi:hypothetical protein BC826DRAFT_966040 [Russula brevipes]|nr:hypothetical protein BC826DRAFT_966040 [Russula brevipes]
MEGPDQNQASHKLIERSHSSTIDGLPDELLLEIFDSYRLNQDEGYRQCWKRKLRWFSLTHVCRRWRCVVFASFSRLDVALIVGMKNPGHMKTIFSPHLSPLPIVIDYGDSYSKTTKELGRVLAALKRCDRVRGITFRGSGRDFDKFLKATKCPFPLLDSLELRNDALPGQTTLPAIFLRGSVPSLRCLSLHGVIATSLSSLLSTCATTLIDLRIGVGSSQATLLLTCLRGMLCLRRLELEMRTINGLTYPTETEPIVSLPNLTRFHFYGCSGFLNAFAARFEAPSLQDVNIGLGGVTPFPNSHLTRFIGDVKKLFRSGQVIFKRDLFRLSLPTRSERIHRAEPHFRFYSQRSTGSLLRMCSALSPELATVEKLSLSFDVGASQYWGAIPWHQFLRLFCSVKAFRMENGDILDLASFLQPTDGWPAPGVLPVLEEIELCARIYLPEQEAELASGLAAFYPFVSARQQAGRPVRVLRGAAAY